jgi:hypothetical protein
MCPLMNLLMQLLGSVGKTTLIFEVRGRGGGGSWPIAEMPAAGRRVRLLECCGRDIDQWFRSPFNQP